jgi:hypothetical protein
MQGKQIIENKLIGKNKNTETWLYSSMVLISWKHMAEETN